MSKNYFNATRIAVLALFSALAGVLYIFNFPISVAFPSFLELNFSDIPALIGTFALGPVSGCIIVVMKILIKLVAQSSSTAFVGELADLFIGFALVIPAGLIYRKLRTYRGAILAMAAGAVASIVVAMIANRILLVPFYVSFFFGGSWDPLIGMMTPLFPGCTRENFYTFYLWASVLPFNALRCLIACLVTLFVYKRISVAINRLVERLTPKGEGAAVRNRKTTLIAVAVCVAVVLLLVLFSLLRYFLW